MIAPAPTLPAARRRTGSGGPGSARRSAAAGPRRPSPKRTVPASRRRRTPGRRRRPPRRSSTWVHGTQRPAPCSSTSSVDLAEHAGVDQPVLLVRLAGADAEELGASPTRACSHRRGVGADPLQRAASAAAGRPERPQPGQQRSRPARVLDQRRAGRRRRPRPGRPAGRSRRRLRSAGSCSCTTPGRVSAAVVSATTGSAAPDRVGACPGRGRRAPAWSCRSATAPRGRRRAAPGQASTSSIDGDRPGRHDAEGEQRRRRRPAGRAAPARSAAT